MPCEVIDDGTNLKKPHIFRIPHRAAKKGGQTGRKWFGRSDIGGYGYIGKTLSETRLQWGIKQEEKESAYGAASAKDFYTLNSASNSQA